MGDIIIYYKENDTLKVAESLEILKKQTIPSDNILWIDLEDPDESCKDFLEKTFNVDFPSDKEIVEIEISSRYLEEGDSIVANTNFASLSSEENFDGEMISMILSKNILFTLRKRYYRAFYLTDRKIRGNIQLFNNGYHVLVSLLETRIDYEADMVEFIAKKIDKISKEIVEDDVDNDILMDIKELQEKSMILRESIIDKQRLLSAFLRSYLFPKDSSERLRILFKDINSLIDYTKFNFERLEYLQDTFLGLVNLEQNKIIKIFTVISVIFFPPTLIASIYGMNFRFMPELHWRYGYLFSLILMFLSSIGTLLFFRYKKWL
jgi:magnesium transporter